jgi:hypothetical protein
MAETTAQFGLQVTGRFEGETGTYYHLNIGSSVKVRLLPGSAEYVCLKNKCIADRKANDCEHVQFVAQHDRALRTAPAAG